MQQAAQATAANEQRNARLAYGTDLIQNMFEGTPSGASLIDLSSINNADIPSATSTGATNPVMAQWLAKNPSYDQSLSPSKGARRFPMGIPGASCQTPDRGRPTGFTTRRATS